MGNFMIPNELLFVISVLVYLGSVLLLYRLFGKNGLFAFAIFGTLLGNIAVCKCIDLFGLSTTAGDSRFQSLRSPSIVIQPAL